MSLLEFLCKKAIFNLGDAETVHSSYKDSSWKFLKAFSLLKNSYQDVDNSKEFFRNHWMGALKRKFRLQQVCASLMEA